MGQINSRQDYLNFLSVVIASAPDKFRQFDFLRPDEQMNLAKAFAELQRGLGRLADNVAPEVMLELRRILDNAQKAYQRGESVSGAHLLQDFEELAFGKN